MIWLAIGLMLVASLLVGTPWITTRCYARHRGPSGRAYVALTIDDGPDALCEALLTVLEAAQVPATFFCVGSKLEAAPDLALRIVADGHELANHTQTHPYLIGIHSSAANHREIIAAQTVIGRYTVPPAWFRAVAGVLSPQVLRAVEKAGLTAIGWTASARDGGPAPVDAPLALRRLERGLVPGGILVLHDRRGGSAAEVIPELARRARARGLEFVTLSKLLDPSAQSSRISSSAAVQSAVGS